jgi:uncharacterized protein (TIGR03437 family)
VKLFSSSSAIQVPASVRTRAGQSTAEFRIDAVSPGEAVVVSAGVGSEVVQATLSVTPDGSKPLRVPGRQFAKPGTELRFQVSAADPSAALSSGTLPVGATFDSLTGEFRWNPAATQIASHTVDFAAVDSQGAKNTGSVAVEVESGEPLVKRIVNTASRSPQAACSAGALATIEGRWLTDGSTASDASGHSPELAGTRVWADGAAVPILSASATELTILCPDTVPGSEVQLVVQTSQGMAEPLQTVIRSATPGIFTLDGTGAGQGLVLMPGADSLATIRNPQVAGQPAMSGDQVVVYATGIDRLANVIVQIGEVQVTPASIGAVANRPGLYRIAVTVPSADWEAGDFPLSLSGDAPDGANWRSNVVKVALEGASK